MQLLLNVVVSLISLQLLLQALNGLLYSPLTIPCSRYLGVCRPLVAFTKSACCPSSKLGKIEINILFQSFGYLPNRLEQMSTIICIKVCSASSGLMEEIGSLLAASSKPQPLFCQEKARLRVTQNATNLCYLVKTTFP